ncbi:hypothetical protein AN396_08035 [Candidatus Epulonipiscium fishelsonii]|uniref:Uncharacterized protein n=1 Tax=Candidatus Epulonipiscium fishelsonii TaxID=77094 RepID=A0ACC8XAJ7_9FIRM|nr:hypothetical protein AN396_08035 [Epulopiscium sp. SCG-B11WGA-EpuloA1]
MMLKLKDIAQEAGVSISTVSRALSPDTKDKVKSSTKTQIDYAIQKLGNESHQSFISSTKDELSVGIILASSNKTFAHEYFAEMLNPLIYEFYKSNCEIKYVLAQASLSENMFLDAIQNRTVSGAVIMGRIDMELLKFFKSNIPHLVYTGVNYVGQNTDEVICNGYEAIKTLFNHFISIGYETIGYIGSTGNNSILKNDYQRFDSYKASLKNYSMNMNNDFIVHSSDTIADGHIAMNKMIKRNKLPQAIICTSDSIAMGVINALYNAGISVPNDIAIAGVDNLNLSQFLTPPLTTVNVPKDELSRIAINMLLDKIRNNRTNNIRVDIPCELIIRKSCGYIQKK